MTGVPTGSGEGEIDRPPMLLRVYRPVTPAHFCGVNLDNLSSRSSVATTMDIGRSCAEGRDNRHIPPAGARMSNQGRPLGESRRASSYPNLTTLPYCSQVPMRDLAI